MFFGSVDYIFLFLPVVLLSYFFLNYKGKFKLSRICLAIANLIFYSINDIKHVTVLLFLILVNFFIAKIISKIQKNEVKIKRMNIKFILAGGIIFNIVLLVYFKYTNFLLSNLKKIGFLKIDIKNIISPLALSFFIFHQICYLMDSYEGVIKEQNFLDYFIFITFFPNIIMGPITHYNNVIEELKKQENLVINNKNLFLGISFFVVGLIKKVIIANNLSFWVKNGFDIAKNLNIIEAWLVSFCYTFQIYFDFSGYSDMAIGSALMFNINLPINFNSPYKASNIQDFWRRWHMTLSDFWQKYIYIPLGGSRKGNFRTYLNILIVFLVSGIWHGAGNTYIVWGLMHGFAMIINRLWRKTNVNINSKISQFITFIFINFTWIIFRSKNIKVGCKILKTIFNFKSLKTIKNGRFKDVVIGDIGGRPKTLFSYLLISLFICKFLKNSNKIIDNIDFKNKFEAVVSACIMSALFLITILFIITKPYHGYIYANF